VIPLDAAEIGDGKKGRLQRAQTLHARGHLVEAEALYREVLRAHSDDVDALEGLGVLMFHRGRLDESRALFERGLAIVPDAARLRGNLAEVLRLLGRPDAAEGEIRRALALDAGSAQSWNVLGHLARDGGRHDDAVEAYREAIRRGPRFVPGYINAGTVLLALRRRAEAAEVLRAALQIEPDNLLALTTLGRTLWELMDPDLVDEAETHCRRALALAPQAPEVLTNLGQVLRLKGRFGEAIECYKRGLELAPDSVSIRISMGELLVGTGRYDDAIRVFKDVARLAPNDARLHTQLGSLAFVRQRFSEAAALNRAALALDPNLAEAHHGLGLALHEQGSWDEAERSYREAVRADPTLCAAGIALARLQAERGDREESCRTARGILALHPNVTDVYVRLATNLKGALPDRDIQAMQRLAEHRYVSHSVRAALHFSLGGVFDGRGFYARAAEHFDAANGLQAALSTARSQSFDAGQYSRMIDRLIATFDPDLLARCRGGGDPDPRPVFVVGLPRSGTTLVEQILASHSRVHGAGELHDVIRLFGAIPESVGQPGGNPFEILRSLGPDAVREVARRYLARLDQLAPPTASRIVDKMPDNYNLLGLIALCWPKARVILCRRDLRDIALSCWQTSFATNPWTNRWEHIVRRFTDHQRLLAHWEQTRPIEWFDVVYEELVCDLEGHARRLIGFLGLDWDPACLEFYKTRRVVRTASHIQVREPIHTRSVGGWRRYEAMLRPFFEASKRHGLAVGAEDRTSTISEGTGTAG
jgi:tetratricopeptide (TPR) repeat protein